MEKLQLLETPPPPPPPTAIMLVTHVAQALQFSPFNKHDPDERRLIKYIFL